MTGTYRMARQTGKSAMFAEVSVRCRWTEQPRNEFTVAAGTPAAWETWARFGAEVFFATRWYDRRGLNVEVEAIRGMAVDTTPPAVAYATYRALVEALGTGDPGTFRFDASTGQFTLGS
jgi:hypothetical protein